MSAIDSEEAFALKVRDLITRIERKRPAPVGASYVFWFFANSWTDQWNDILSSLADEEWTDVQDRPIQACWDPLLSLHCFKTLSDELIKVLWQTWGQDMLGMQLKQLLVGLRDTDPHGSFLPQIKEVQKVLARVEDRFAVNALEQDMRSDGHLGAVSLAHARKNDPIRILRCLNFMSKALGKRYAEVGAAYGLYHLQGAVRFTFVDIIRQLRKVVEEVDE